MHDFIGGDSVITYYRYLVDLVQQSDVLKTLLIAVNLPSLCKRSALVHVAVPSPLVIFSSIAGAKWLKLKLGVKIINLFKDCQF